MRKLFLLLLFISCRLSLSAQEWIKFPIDSIQKNGVIYSTIKTCGHVFSNAVLDTGATMVSLTYSDYVALKKDGTLKKAKFIKNARMLTPNKIYSTAIYSFDTLYVGDIELRNVWVLFYTDPTSVEVRMIGQNVMRRLGKLYIDWPTNSVFVMPPK